MFFLSQCFTELFQELAFSRRCEWYPLKRWQFTRALFLQVSVTPSHSRFLYWNNFTFCHLLLAITRQATIRCDRGMCNYKKCRTSGCCRSHHSKARYYGNINLACPCFSFFFFFFNGGAIERNGERMLEKERKEDFVYYALMESQKQRGKSVFICLSCWTKAARSLWTKKRDVSYSSGGGVCWASCPEGLEQLIQSADTLLCNRSHPQTDLRHSWFSKHSQHRAALCGQTARSAPMTNSVSVRVWLCLSFRIQKFTKSC